MLVNQFKTIHEKKNEMLILISHQERIIEMADRINVIEDGKIILIGAKEEILPNLLTKASCACMECLGGEQQMALLDRITEIIL